MCLQTGVRVWQRNSWRKLPEETKGGYSLQLCQWRYGLVNSVERVSEHGSPSDASLELTELWQVELRWRHAMRETHLLKRVSLTFGGVTYFDTDWQKSNIRKRSLYLTGPTSIGKSYFVNDILQGEAKWIVGIPDNRGTFQVEDPEIVLFVDWKQDFSFLSTLMNGGFILQEHQYKQRRYISKHAQIINLTNVLCSALGANPMTNFPGAACFMNAFAEKGLLWLQQRIKNKNICKIRQRQSLIETRQSIQTSDEWS